MSPTKSSWKSLSFAAMAATAAGSMIAATAFAGGVPKEQRADIEVRDETAEVVSTNGLTGRTNTSYTTTNLERIRTQGLTGRTSTSYQPALGIGHSSGLTGRTDF